MHEDVIFKKGETQIDCLRHVKHTHILGYQDVLNH